MKSCGIMASLCCTSAIALCSPREAFSAALWALSEPTTKTTSPELSGTPGAHKNAKRAPPLLDQAPPKGGDKPKREKRGTRRATGGVRTPGGRCFPSRITTAGGCRRRRKSLTPPGLTAARAQARPGRHAQTPSCNAAAAAINHKERRTRTAKDGSTTARGTISRRPTEGERNRRDRHRLQSDGCRFACLRRQARRTAARRKRTTLILQKETF